MMMKSLATVICVSAVGGLLAACTSTKDLASDDGAVILEVEDELAGDREIGASGSLSQARATKRVRLSAADQAELARQGNAPNIVTSVKASADYCPKIEILNGTGVLTAYIEGGDDLKSDITHQASITRSGRECAKQDEFLNIRVGAAGRAVRGPKSLGNDVTLPIRIAVVQNGTDVLYSQIYTQQVNFTNSVAQGFSLVEEQLQVPFPEEENLKILVGFDVVGDPSVASTTSGESDG